MLLNGEYVTQDKWHFGASIVHDAVGLTNLNGGNLRGAFHIIGNDQSNDQTILSVGLSLGLYQYRYQPWKGQTHDLNDKTALKNYQQGVFDGSFGVFLNHKFKDFDDNTLYAGVSLPQTFSLNFAKDGENALTRYPHLFFLVGGYIFVENDQNKLFFEPSACLRYVPKIPIQMDVNLRVNLYQLMIGGGVGISPIGGLKLDVIHGELGTRWPLGDKKILKFGFGYDFTTNNAATRLGNSFEFSFVLSGTMTR